jgi:uncharacterized SAM-dependent methyltransferase
MSSAGILLRSATERGRRSESEFAAAVLAGLRHQQKELPCKYFYDAEGSRLFDLICELPEYYPTRTEVALFRDKAGAIAGAVGGDVELIEFGAGSLM